MKTPSAAKIFMGVTGAILTLAVVSVLVLSTLDWNRAKPWLTTRVSEASGRTFLIKGDLSLTWQKLNRGETGWRALLPWPRLSAQDVTFGNPDWAAAAGNMAEIKNITFSINPFALLNNSIVIPALYLDTPTLSLRRAADGRTNWTFASTPASKWQLNLQSLVIDKGVVKLKDAVQKLDLIAGVDTIENTAGGDYGITWKVRGTFNKAEVSGSGKAGAVLSLQNETTRYPLAANVHVGKTTVAIVGTLTNPRKLSGLNMRLKLSGASLAHLYALSGIVLPETPPFSTDGQLIGSFETSNSKWKYERFSGTVGASDLAGTIVYESKQPRPVLKGDIVSKVLRLADLAPLIGADSNASKLNRGAPLIQPADKVLPVEPFHTERWGSVDADVKFSGRTILRDKQLPINNLTANIQLKDSVLSLTPLTMGVAGGDVNSDLVLDGHAKVIKATVKVAARHLKLKELLPDFQPMRASLGEINGDASLSATGNSVAALLGSSNGEIKALINQGTISKLILEEMGLNIGNIILAKLFGDKQVPLTCLAGDFTVTNGLMQQNVFVIDTSDALLIIGGNIDLAHEQLALVIKPESKGLRIISLRSPIYVGGTFKQPRVSIDKRILALKAGGAIALAAAAPVAALLPLIKVGQQQDSQCADLLASLRDKPVAPPPGTRYRETSSPAKAIK